MGNGNIAKLMGYSTNFTGVLKFKKELKASGIALLQNIIDNADRMDIEITKKFDGIQWDGMEKTYGLTESVNDIINEMKAVFPDFELVGELLAQGEEFSDRWLLKIVDGKAVEQKIVIKGKKITCPHCDEDFVLEEED